MREHVATLNDPARYAMSVQHLLRFFDREKRLGTVIGGVAVSDVNKRFVDRFINFRRGEGVGGHTISRDLAALRGALNHAWREERIAAVPFVKDVDGKDKAKPRELVYSMEDVAAILEAAYSRPDRHHVFLYTLIQLSTCGRSEAILELEKETQVRDGLIYFLDGGEAQTSKRRSIVPVAPTLAPWLEEVRGKVIVYRAPIAPKRWADPEVPEWFTRPCADIGRAFDACLIEAGLSRSIIGAEGETRTRGIGTPNTLRHTAITEMHRRGVPEAQIDAAAGHAGEGTGKRNYRHLRPDYLADLIAAVEDYWREMTRCTTVHLRTQCGPNIVSFAQARAGRRERNA